MVGTARFELATYGTQNRRATRLRYAPTEETDNDVFRGMKPQNALQMQFLVTRRIISSRHTAKGPRAA